MLAFITQNNGQNHVDNQGAILECMQRQQNIYTKYKLGTCNKNKVIYVTCIYTQCVLDPMHILCAELAKKVNGVHNTVHFY